MSAVPMSRYRRKEPILGYVTKNDKKKEFMHLRVNGCIIITVNLPTYQLLLNSINIR